MPKRKIPSCPSCGAKRVLPIYGYPPPGEMDRLMKAVDRGEIHLGGCCVSGNDPNWHCARCGHEWREVRSLVPV